MDFSETERFVTNSSIFKHDVYPDSLLVALSWICKDIDDVNSEQQRRAALKHWLTIRGEKFMIGLMKCLSQ